MVRARFESERLAFRLAGAADLEDLVALDADPEVMRRINGGQETPREEVERFIIGAQGWLWTIQVRDTGQFAGWVSLRPSGARERELGYRLRRQMWGRGYATEGCRTVIHLAFAEMGVERVWGQTMTVNTGSRRVMEKAGLRYVRTFFVDWPEVIEGSGQGDVEYEITRTEWQTAATREAR